MHIRAIILPLFATAVLSACSTTATLTAISGPAALRKDRPITARIEGIAGNSGKMSFTLPDGELVSGQWVAVMGKMSMTKGAATAHGNRGTVFDVEFECDSSARGIGKATDSKGNTYRVLVHGI